MTRTDISWPEMGINPAGGDSTGDEPVEEWVEDPFRRKVLYVFHFIAENSHIATTALFTAVVVGISDYVGLMSSAASNATFSLVLVSSVFVVTVDAVIAHFYQSVINAISFRLSYGVLLVAAYLYGYVEKTSISRSRISIVLSSSVVEHIPAIGLRKKLDRTLRPRF
ncbi:MULTISPECIES: hypothetical protein [Halococcus]|uniref:hypothetical protein n=1 Tax=Halococcus TaxID=2249 RepID=UPI001268A55C|nr:MULTISPECIES: hypothetical protein [Halococcus]